MSIDERLTHSLTQILLHGNTLVRPEATVNQTARVQHTRTSRTNEKLNRTS